MNYFEFYDIKPAFEIDLAGLKKKFLQKSKLLHPDFHAGSSGEMDEVLDKAAMNNLAYKTLSNQDSRYIYLLELCGAPILEGAEKLPQEFLMEMMDLNELLMDMQFDYSDEKYEEARVKIESKKQEINNELQEIVKGLENQDLLIESSEKLLSLNKIKSCTLKNRYLDRLIRNLNTQKQ